MTDAIQGVFDLFGGLQNPAYQHALINHFPIIGSILAALALAAALLTRTRAALMPGLLIAAVAGISAWPTYFTGSEAYKPIRKLSDDAGIDFLDLHMDRADEATWVFYLFAGLALLAWATLSKWPRLATALSTLTLLAALASTIAGIYIARPGGCVRHPEFRPSPAPEEPKILPQHE